MGIIKKKAFTLIEIVVVIAVISLILPVVFSIFFVLLQQQTKIYRLNTVKKEGDYVINLIDNTLKERAVTIHTATPPNDANKVCTSGPPPYSSISKLYFLDQNGAWFGYILNGNSIATASAGIPLIDFTSSKVRISSFSISCLRHNPFSKSVVSLSFNIEYCANDACNQTRPEETASLFYQTKIKLRN